MKLDGLRKEGFGSGHVARLAEVRFDKVAVFVDAPIQVAPHPFETDVHFID